MSTITQRKIGDAVIPAIGYGAMGLGGVVYGAADNDEQRFKLLDRLFELGCTHWDTANAGLYGDSEELIGKWFERTGKRDKIFLATKFGYSDTGVRGDPAFIRQRVEDSLKKLKTNYIDLLYQHRPDSNTPIEITVGTMKELVSEGKVRYLGLSECSPDTIRRAVKIAPIAALQIEYSPWERDTEKAGHVIPTAREFGIKIVAYSPVGRGLLTGTYKSQADLPEDDYRRFLPRYAPKNWPRINELVSQFQQIGIKYKATPSQIALALLLTLGDDVIPIPGTRRVEFAEQNVSAEDIHLADEDIQKLRRLSDEVTAAFSEDDRYPPQFLALLYRETPPLQS